MLPIHRARRDDDGQGQQRQADHQQATARRGGVGLLGGRPGVGVRAALVLVELAVAEDAERLVVVALVRVASSYVEAKPGRRTGCRRRRRRRVRDGAAYAPATGATVEALIVSPPTASGGTGRPSGRPAGPAGTSAGPCGPAGGHRARVTVRGSPSSDVLDHGLRGAAGDDAGGAGRGGGLAVAHPRRQPPSFSSGARWGWVLTETPERGRSLSSETMAATLVIAWPGSVDRARRTRASRSEEPVRGRGLCSSPEASPVRQASSRAPSAAMSPSTVPVAAGTARRPTRPLGRSTTLSR